MARASEEGAGSQCQISYTVRGSESQVRPAINVMRADRSQLRRQRVKESLTRGEREEGAAWVGRSEGSEKGVWEKWREVKAGVSGCGNEMREMKNGLICKESELEIMLW